LAEAQRRVIVIGSERYVTTAQRVLRQEEAHVLTTAVLAVGNTVTGRAQSHNALPELRHSKEGCAFMTRPLSMIYLMTMSLIVVSLSSALAQTTSNPSPVQTKKPQPQIKQPQPEPKVSMAKWDATTGGLMGVSKEEFDSMGLGKLTDVEYLAFMSWDSRKRQTVTQETLASQLTYSCGRSNLEALDYEKVNIYLMMDESTPAELASRIRQNLRAISDVQIVFSSKDADLIVQILGYQIDSLTNQKTGYAASVVTADPCVSQIGSQRADFGQYRHMFLQTGGTDTSRLAESITTSLDAADIEAARKNNADIRQILKNMKK
jgi:hypothetical protein